MLSSIQNRLLANIQHEAQTSLAEIAARSGLKQHTIQYHLQRLRSQEIVSGPRPFINTYLLGLTDYVIYFSLASVSTANRQKVIKKLIASDRVSWLAELGGEFHYAFAFCARRFEEVAELIAGLSSTSTSLFHEKSLAGCLSFTTFGRKYLWPEAKKIKVFQRKRGAGFYSIDEVDHSILSVMANQSWQSLRHVSRLSGVALSTVERRVKQLEAKKIISGYLYRIDLNRPGIQRYRLMLNCRGYTPQMSQKLRAFAENHENVQHFLEYLGAWDFELGVELFRAEELPALVDSLYAHMGEMFATVKIIQIFSHLKYAPYPFVSLPEHGA